MTAKSIYFSDIKEAVLTGKIPAITNQNHDGLDFPRIDYKNKRGAKLYWQISVYLLDENENGIQINDGAWEPANELVIGKIVVARGQGDASSSKVDPTFIRSGKNKGKVNATNPFTQAIREAFSKYNKQRDRTTIGENPPPMLVQTLDSGSRGSQLTDEDFEDGITIQRKFDGIRTVAHKVADGSIELYSRSGKPFTGEYQNIRSELSTIIHSQNIFLDGEVYKHGIKLMEISGQARRKTNQTNELEFHVFDMFDLEKLDMTGEERQAKLDELLAHSYTYIKRVENFTIKNRNELNDKTKQFLRDGYEGSIIRRNKRAYEFSLKGYHSTNVLKFKPWFTDEFTIVDFDKSDKGKMAGAVVFIMETKDKKNTFRALPKDMGLPTMKKMYKYLSQKNRFERKLKGKLATIEYQDLSSDGIPQRLRFVAVRTYEPNSGDKQDGHDVFAKIVSKLS